MKLLKDIIRPIVFNGPKNVYALGLSLKNGDVCGLKVYNKIYSKDEQYHSFLERFGGKTCLQDYLLSNRWLELYPGFSGFTIGAEFRDSYKFQYGYGYKTTINNELVFCAKYLSASKEVVKEEIYHYTETPPHQSLKKKMKSDIFEVKNGSYCFCPKISHVNIPEIEDEVKFSLSPKNREIFAFIKNSKNRYSILNYGQNRHEEKIYLVSHDNNKDIDLLLELISELYEEGFLTWDTHFGYA